MLGDGFFSRSGPIAGNLNIDRLFVGASDLDAPGILPPGGQVLTITEAGPVGVFSSSVNSVQDLQAILRNGQPVPASTLEGQVVDNSTLTTSITIADVQALLAGTPEAYDVIPLIAPPGTYLTGVDAVFQARNSSVGGTTTYDAGASGALLQGGVDTLNGGEVLDAYYYYDYMVSVNIDLPHAAAVRSGLTKIANGGTPLPQDRIYFQYGLFEDTAFAANGSTVNRFVPGFERAFLADTVSLEMRFPFVSATTNDGIVGQSGMTNSNDVQFGDISVFAKVLLSSGTNYAVSGGLAVTIPTADDLDYRLADGTPFVSINTDSVHIGPFLAALYAPNDRFFAQGFLQFDFDANGNEVLANTNGTGLQSIGRLNDSSYVFADAGLGYWINPRSNKHAAALMAELHYNGNISETDVAQSGTFQVGGASGSIDVVNLTVGGSVELSKNTQLTAGYVAPISDERQFDGGFRMNVEYRP